MIVGMPRSGTTWAFNVVRLAMGARVGRELWLSFVISNKLAKHELVKVHGYGAGATDEKIVLSYRSLVDLAASRARMGWPHDLETIRADVKNFRLWQAAGAAICFSYEAMIVNPPQMALALLLAVGIDVTRQEAAEISEEVDDLPDWSGRGSSRFAHDSQTFMHSDHRKAGGRVGNRDGLDPAIAAAIEAEGWVLP